MSRIVFHVVKVRWNDGRTELFRYETEAQAREAERYQFVENWKQTKSASYVGRRIHWGGVWDWFRRRGHTGRS